jgi:cell pole-organizing protein PopZ
VPEEPPPMRSMADLDALVSESTAAASAQAIHSLTKVHAGGRTLEDIVKECLRPLLKEWLDRNLTALVERAVQREIRRITGQID